MNPNKISDSRPLQFPVTVDVTDNSKSKRLTSGILALQLHAGPPMLVQFKNIRLKVLDE